MKKNILLIAMAFVCSSIYAVTVPDITAKMTITISHDQGANDDVVNLFEMPTATLTQMTQFSSNKFMNGGLPENLNIYALNDSVHQGRLGTLATTSLIKQFIGVATNQVATNYTFKFTGVSITDPARKLYLFDLQEGTKNEIVGDLSYSFVAAKADTIETRFMIDGEFTPDPGELAVCVYFNEIQINNNPYTTDIVIKDADGNVVLTRVPVSTPQIISLENLASGHYFLEIGTESFEFCNKPVSE